MHLIELLHCLSNLYMYYLSLLVTSTRAIILRNPRFNLRNLVVDYVLYTSVGSSVPQNQVGTVEPAGYYLERNLSG